MRLTDERGERSVSTPGGTARSAAAASRPRRGRVAGLVLSIVAGVGAGAAAGAQSYDPEGPQTGVDRVAVVEAGGWQLCFASSYAERTGGYLATILAGCAGERMMLSCGQAGEATLVLLAQAPTADVTFTTANDVSSAHEANGTRWYHHYDGTGNDGSGYNAWGFAGPGTALEKNNCDTEESESPELRLCFHLNPNGGYRCGSTTSLNEATDWTKYVHFYTTAIFEDGFEEAGGDLCSWSASTDDGCAESATLALDNSLGCGEPIADGGPDDLDPEEGVIGYRLTWSDLRREWAYRLQVDEDNSDFTEEDGWTELPAGSEGSAILRGNGLFQRTYRLIAHQGHAAGHGAEPIAGDVVSNTCGVASSPP